jgi:hypothetical protein
VTNPPTTAEAPPTPLSQGKKGVRRIFSSGKRRTPDRPCLNCGDPTVGNFCPVCGQRKVEVRVSLRRMLLEAIEDQFSLNAALPRTLGALFFHPGRLTSEYMAGRIARYIPPFRLYLFASLVFFLMISFNDVDGSFVSDGGVNVQVGNAPDSATAARRAEALRRAAEARQAGGRWTDDMDINTPWPALNRALMEKRDELGRMTPQQAGRAIVGDFMERIPTMMFVLLPVFAAVLKLLYVRRKRFYVEHFVFALHAHAFTYLLFTVMALVGLDVVTIGLTLWMLLYYFLAMKRVYGQGWTKTGIKYVALTVSYLVLLGVATAITLVVTVLLL